jgi:hypothetical protein
MKHKIDTNYTEMLEQAQDTADSYLSFAIFTIDNKLGEGYAKQHPELISAFMRVSMGDFNANCIAQTIQDSVEHISEIIESIYTDYKRQ